MKLHEKLPQRISRWPVKWVHHQEKRMSVFGASFLHAYRGAILLGFFNGYLYRWVSFPVFFFVLRVGSLGLHPTYKSAYER